MDDLSKLRIGVSACLVGAKVRFDGGHKRDDFVSDVLARFCVLEPVCPEMLLGLGAPRPSLRLIAGARLVEPKSGRDLTEPMSELSAHLAERLRAHDLSGFIFKKDSPTCGMERVRVYEENGIPRRDGVGLFAAAVRAAMPLLPVEEEGRLRDRRLREAFLTRVFAYRSVTDLFAAPWTLAELQRFHARWKMLLLAWSPAQARALGRLVAQAGAADDMLADAYRAAFMAALAVPPTRARHVNVLEHLAGGLRGRAGDDERRELHEAIARFARGELPLAAPLLLVQHHVRRHRLDWVAAQTYFAPYPAAIGAEVMP